MTTLEKSVQRDVILFFEGLGCRVYRLSQARATRQTPGLPDLWIFCPRKQTGFWFEVKDDCGRPSAEQVTFGESCMACGIGHAMGGMGAARVLARSLGLTWAPAA